LIFKDKDRKLFYWKSNPAHLELKRTKREQNGAIKKGVLIASHNLDNYLLKGYDENQ